MNPTVPKIRVRNSNPFRFHGMKQGEEAVISLDPARAEKTGLVVLEVLGEEKAEAKPKGKPGPKPKAEKAEPKAEAPAAPDPESPVEK